LPLRFISLTATLITASLPYAIGRREGAGHIVAFAGAALFLAGYQITGGFYDLARVDMLFIALSLAGMALAVYTSNSAWGLIGAGLLMGLAFLTKQNGLFLAAVVGGYLLLTVGRRVWVYALSLILVAGVPTLWLHFSSNGWFSFYVFDIAYASPVSWQRLVKTLGREIMGAMTVLALAFVLLGLLSFRRYRWHVLRRQPWLLFIPITL
jgi:4-amino-4-deoxy-L-arabinose transferase-like glycosyltransferase